MRQRILATVIGLLVLAGVGHAQVNGPINITANDASGVCTTASACATFSLNNNPVVNVSIDISGTWTGTLTFQATVDDTTWRTIPAVNVATGVSTATTTAGGTFSIANAGYSAVRVEATAAVTGTAVVNSRRGYAPIGVAKLQPLFTGYSTATCNTATLANVGVGETDLCIFPMQPGQLGLNGNKLRVTTWGVYANNANSKSLRLYFGATLIASRVGDTSANGPWKMSAIVTRTGASTSIAFGDNAVNGSGSALAVTSPADSLAASVSVRFTGQSATAGGDVTITGMFVELVP